MQMKQTYPFCTQSLQKETGSHTMEVNRKELKKRGGGLDVSRELRALISYMHQQEAGIMDQIMRLQSAQDHKYGFSGLNATE